MSRTEESGDVFLKHDAFLCLTESILYCPDLRLWSGLPFRGCIPPFERIYSFHHSFIDSLVRSFIYSFVFNRFNRSITCSFTESKSPSPSHSLSVLHTFGSIHRVDDALHFLDFFVFLFFHLFFFVRFSNRPRPLRVVLFQEFVKLKTNEPRVTSRSWVGKLIHKKKIHTMSCHSWFLLMGNLIHKEEDSHIYNFF